MNKVQLQKMLSPNDNYRDFDDKTHKAMKTIQMEGFRPSDDFRPRSSDAIVYSASDNATPIQFEQFRQGSMNNYNNGIPNYISDVHQGYNQRPIVHTPQMNDYYGYGYNQNNQGNSMYQYPNNHQGYGYVPQGNQDYIKNNNMYNMNNYNKNQNRKRQNSKKQQKNKNIRNENTKINKNLNKRQNLKNIKNNKHDYYGKMNCMSGIWDEQQRKELRDRILDVDVLFNVTKYYILSCDESDEHDNFGHRILEGISNGQTVTEDEYLHHISNQVHNLERKTSLYELERDLSIVSNNNRKLYKTILNRIYDTRTVRSLSKSFGNRAASKLSEIARATDFIYKLQEEYGTNRILGLCDGPGSWTRYLLKKLSNATAYGLTKASDDESCNWYDDLINDERFTPISKENGNIFDGNVFIEFWKYVNAVVSVNEEFKSRCVSDIHRPFFTIVVADGGDQPNSEEDYEMKEACHFKLLQREVFFGLTFLCRGGTFIIKLYDSKLNVTMSLIYLLTRLFTECSIVKPKYSRGINDEKYLVCKDFLSYIKNNRTYDAKKVALLSIFLGKEANMYRKSQFYSTLCDPTEFDRSFTDSFMHMENEIDIYRKYSIEYVESEMMIEMAYMDRSKPYRILKEEALDKFDILLNNLKNPGNFTMTNVASEYATNVDVSAMYDEAFKKAKNLSNYGSITPTESFVAMPANDSFNKYGFEPFDWAEAEELDQQLLIDMSDVSRIFEG
jgi:23S rRNA U2552 (ribose-2'-O)-methylase RlmE/FtsJ/major membrane immunogen (membrane-anchored lipoprotein)